MTAQTEQRDTPDCSKLDAKELDCLERNEPEAQWCESCRKYDAHLQADQRATAQPFIRDLLRTSRTLTDTESKLLAHAERLAEALKKQMWATEALNVLGHPNYIANQKSNYDEARKALAAWEGAR
jgi:hypothetical protein